MLRGARIIQRETSTCGGVERCNFEIILFIAISPDTLQGPFRRSFRRLSPKTGGDTAASWLKGKSKKDRQIRHAVFCCLFRASVYAITTADPGSFVQIRMRASDWLGAAAHVREICKRAFTVGRSFFRKLVSLPANSCAILGDLANNARREYGYDGLSWYIMADFRDWPATMRPADQRCAFEVETGSTS